MSQKKRLMATTKSDKPKSKSFRNWVLSIFFLVSLGSTVFFLLKTDKRWFSGFPGSDAVYAEIVENSVDSIDHSTENGESKNISWQVAFNTSVEFIREPEIEEFVKSRLDETFFTLNMDEVNRVLLSHPWIKRVVSRKVWPNTLLIDVEEHQPWFVLNKTQLISKEGIVFTPSNAESFSELPLLEGQFGDLSDLLSMYHSLSEQMPSDDYRITRLSYHPHNGWQLSLANEVVLFLGKKELTERLDRFLTVLAELKSKHNNTISYIDLRYQSGLAIGWKSDKSPVVIAQN